VRERRDLRIFAAFLPTLAVEKNAGILRNVLIALPERRVTLHSGPCVRIVVAPFEVEPLGGENSNTVPGGRGRRHERGQREVILELILEAQASGVRLAPACRVLGISARTIER